MNKRQYPNEIQEFYHEELKWCDCGNAGKSLEFMRDVLQDINAKDTIIAHPDTTTPTHEIAWAVLRDCFSPCGYDHPLAQSYLYMLDAHELLDHGSSIGGVWLTDKGRKILKLLESYPLQDALDEKI